jgi:ABC-type Mn2+/Zn2+ transport system permease subunit
VWAALKAGLYVVLFLRGHAIWVIIAETVSALFSNPADATTPEKRKRAQEAKDEARAVTAASSFGMGLVMIYLAKSAIDLAEARSSGGGEAGLIWIISAPIFVIGVVLVIVVMFLGGYWALSNKDPDEKNE